jgi:type II restriction/modification system DNA methylase subunit YeeA
LKENTTILKLIDFSGYRVFAQTVDTNIILFRKQKPQKDHIFEFVEVRRNVDDIIDYIKSNSNTMLQEKLSDNTWTLGDDRVLALKEKIEKIGKPLKDWNVKIYRGILTGYNDAFIIDTETRNKILANCKTEEERKRTEEIMKPVLRGRDIEKYYYKWAGLWLIYIPWHFPLHNDNSISGASLKAEEEFQKQYSSLYNYLLQFKGGLSNRNKDETGIRYEWYALQRWASDYYHEFGKEKIVWQHVSGRYEFAYVPGGIYLNNALFMIMGNPYVLKYMLGILNSKFADYLLLLFTNLTSLGKYAYGAKDKIEQLPLPPITKENQPLADQIVQKVQEILSLTQSPDYGTNKEKQQRVKELEKQIDELVYKLYNLTEEEIKIIEGEK